MGRNTDTVPLSTRSIGLAASCIWRCDLRDASRGMLRMSCGVAALAAHEAHDHERGRAMTGASKGRVLPSGPERPTESVAGKTERRQRSPAQTDCLLANQGAAQTSWRSTSSVTLRPHAHERNDQRVASDEVRTVIQRDIPESPGARPLRPRTVRHSHRHRVHPESGPRACSPKRR